MKAFLMHRNRDFDLQQALLSDEQALTQDLALNTLFNAMALGDEFLFSVAHPAVLAASSDIDTILYRQDILKDCLANSSVIREIYQITIDSVEDKQRRWYSIFGSSPGSILHSSVGMMKMFVGLLAKLKYIADEHACQFHSEGFTKFFSMIKRELNDEYFSSIQEHLDELEFRNGVLISAVLGRGNEGTDYILRKSHGVKYGWLRRLFYWIRQVIIRKSNACTFFIHPRDINGSRALTELNDRGINLVANAIAQSADHIDNFFKMLRVELSFYIGCLNLHEKLMLIGEPVSYPQPFAVGTSRYSFKDLYDICLALNMKQRIVGNDANADNKDLAIITGANQGGKSTFLRSVGLAQLMMQCGMFVPAELFRCSVCDGLFTHFKREEDASMTRGKLDEELARMSNIADSLTSNSMVLFNESFAATNEREGSEIARQIAGALLEKHVKVFFVTHLYEFAHGFYNSMLDNVIFLRADRQSDGKGTFKLHEGEPLQTSYGEDLYIRVFGAAEQ